MVIPVVNFLRVAKLAAGCLVWKLVCTAPQNTFAREQTEQADFRADARV